MRNFNRADGPRFRALFKFFKKAIDGKPLPADIDEQIADLLQVELRPFMTSMDAAFSLLDEVFAFVEPVESKEHLAINLRDYPGTHYLCLEVK